MISKFKNITNSKISWVIVALIAIPFVFWGMGDVFTRGNTNNVAKINNTTISVTDFINHDPTLDFMTSSIKCRNIFKFKSPAVTHVDKSARPQIIYKKKDLFLWKLLRKWESFSNEMSLVNTSFNTHEQPIISNQYEGVESLKKGMIDVLYIENYRITH